MEFGIINAIATLAYKNENDMEAFLLANYYTKWRCKGGLVALQRIGTTLE